MREILLHGRVAAGRVAHVDDEDFELVSEYRWHAQKLPASRTFYAKTKTRQADGSIVNLLIHKLLTGWDETDHINHDGLDNQRENLRETTHKQNLAGRQPNANSKWSQYKGVTWDSRASKWSARIQNDGKTHRLGRFNTEEEAAHAYNTAALEAYGPHAYLNQIHKIPLVGFYIILL